MIMKTLTGFAKFKIVILNILQFLFLRHLGFIYGRLFPY